MVILLPPKIKGYITKMNATVKLDIKSLLLKFYKDKQSYFVGIKQSLMFYVYWNKNQRFKRILK